MYYLSLGNCFSGGILFASGIVFMIPSRIFSDHLLEIEAAHELNLESPIPQIFTVVGFFILIAFQYSGIVGKIQS